MANNERNREKRENRWSMYRSILQKKRSIYVCVGIFHVNTPQKKRNNPKKNEVTSWIRNLP
jgi:hypothetical protein